METICIQLYIDKCWLSRSTLQTNELVTDVRHFITCAYSQNRCKMTCKILNKNKNLLLNRLQFKSRSLTATVTVVYSHLWHSLLTCGVIAD